MGRYADAEPLYRRSLAILEAKLGPDHPDVATGLNNLAALYRAQGRYAEAEPLYRRSLAIREASSAPTTPTWPQPEQPGGPVPSAGRYAEAEPLYRRSLGDPREARSAPTTPTWPQA